MGSRKDNTKEFPSRQSLPRRSKEKTQSGSGIYEEKERTVFCRDCGEYAVLRNIDGRLLKGKNLIFSTKEIQELPIDTKVECAVCCSTFKGKYFFVLHCKHRFHKRCIMQWFETDVRCPLCRK
ncbi:e3 ubiquitin-protein ligase ATL6 [Trichonephila inaurata madagascariensis]|uniref:E3 ubiquitin-protein ligase ATL6 n=1 Tax=Trichonephila inaurata madagascariensis TaxID=2747483 RepID=A0A8X7C6F3_9ARAC|nr:e3 ubiquitin-protein ligase ATL6 [Trichonephila inaurata madagascariensis]